MHPLIVGEKPFGQVIDREQLTGMGMPRQIKINALFAGIFYPIWTMM
jgi:hypothetical protein